jgi:hypothetical protein
MLTGSEITLSEGGQNHSGIPDYTQGIKEAKMNDYKVCRYPGCFNEIPYDSKENFCEEHRNEIWFQPEKVRVMVGDRNIGHMKLQHDEDADEELVKMSVCETLHPSKFKEVTDAIHSRMNFLFEERFHYHEDDWKMKED